MRAQSRELHWKALNVEARLDSTGVLHVSERQSIVFTGDWNGGERRFNIRPGQTLNLESVSRVDTVTGQFVPLTRGSLSSVDTYGWVNGALRWRARAESDPPFNQTSLTYTIDYTIGNILIPKDGAYVLDHNFAFPDRDGEIETFTLHLTLDPVWQAPPDFQEHYTTNHVYPGDSYVVTRTLQFRGAGRPASVEFGPSLGIRGGLAALLALVLAVLITRFFVSERAIGRFAPLVPASQIDEAWLKANVFSMLPEVVGALWDDSTGAAEVAAILARMELEGKIKSEVKTTKVAFFTTHELHMTLLVERERLPDYENRLMAAFFKWGSDTTSTSEVRARYRKTGFDPAAIIKPSLDRLKKVATGVGSEAPKPTAYLTLLLLLAAIACLAYGTSLRPIDFARAAPYLAAVVAVTLFSFIQSGLWQKRVVSPAAHTLRFLIPMLGAAIAVATFLLNPDTRSGALILTGLTLLLLAFFNSVLNVARWRQSAERLALRKRLAAARLYFIEELRKPTPTLRNEWYPYFLGFGLGANVDKWFRAFGGERATSAIATGAYASSSLGSSSSSSSSPSFSGFGGGGAFAGGGSSGSWSSAVSSFASGVSAPSSSSSSGGGGGGGGSSGGGGGGGW